MWQALINHPRWHISGFIDIPNPVGICKKKGRIRHAVRPSYRNDYRYALLKRHDDRMYPAGSHLPDLQPQLCSRHGFSGKEKETVRQVARLNALIDEGFVGQITGNLPPCLIFRSPLGSAHDCTAGTTDRSPFKHGGPYVFATQNSDGGTEHGTTCSTEHGTLAASFGYTRIFGTFFNPGICGATVEQIPQVPFTIYQKGLLGNDSQGTLSLVIKHHLHRQ
jgi:hypothetical protein